MGGARALAAAAARAREVRREHPLCDPCTGRMFARRMSLSSALLLGRRISAEIGPARGPCFVCRGLAESLGPAHEAVRAAAAGYEFASVLVGVTIRPSMAERDDVVRSRHRLAGADGVKAYLSGALAARLARRAGARVDRADPDLTVTADLRDMTAEARSRPLVLEGRYTKSLRGMPQKRHECAGCSGAGCGACGGTGAAGPSVEGEIAAYVGGRLSARRVRMTWIGGEDRDSLVGGAGRPFFAQAVDPRSRGARFPARADLRGVSVLGLRPAPGVPSGPVRFRSAVRMSVRAASPLGPGALEAAESLGGAELAVYEGGRRAVRTAHSARAERTGPDTFDLLLEVDGGVPLRRIAGGDAVFPNLSGLTGAECTAERIDVEGVSLQ